MSDACQRALEELFSPEARANPYPAYAQLRESDPVYDTGQGLWLVTSYDACHMLLRDDRISKNFHTLSDYEQNLELTGRSETWLQALIEQLISFSDPPDHTRKRGLFQKTFTPRMIERLRPRVQDLVDEHLDEMGDGEVDLIADFASRLPLAVVAELLGMPRADRELLRRWSLDLAPTFEVVMTPETVAQAEKAGAEFIDYFKELTRERQRDPKEDLISALAQVEEEGDKLTLEELVVNLILLVGAGHETPMNLIGNGTLALVRNPDQLELLRRRPEIMEDAIEELIRYDSPLQWTTRFPKAPIEIDGRVIPAGTRVALVLAAANRDPKYFRDPDRLDLTRGVRHHVGFGGGLHYCMGNALARMEGGIIFRTLIGRYPHIELLTDTPEYHGTLLRRGVKSLPLHLETRARERARAPVA